MVKQAICHASRLLRRRELMKSGTRCARSRRTYRRVVTAARELPGCGRYSFRPIR